MSLRASITVDADTSSAENKCDMVQTKADKAIKTTETARTRYMMLFNQAIHMANIWSNLIAQNYKGLIDGAKMQAIQQGLQIMAAETAIFQTGLEAKQSFLKGDIIRGTMQIALIASMQGMLFRMMGIQSKQNAAAARAEQAAQMWVAYRGG